MAIRRVSSCSRRRPRGRAGGGTEGGGGSMKVRRRFAVLLAVVLAAGLSVLGGRATQGAHASTKVAKLTIWVDNVQKPAVTKVTNAWGARRGGRRERPVPLVRDDSR